MPSKIVVRNFLERFSLRQIFTILAIVFLILTLFIIQNPKPFLNFGYIGIFVFNTIASGFLIIPIIGTSMHMPLVILACALGNIINTSMSYFIGYSSTRLFTSKPIVVKVKNLMQKYTVLTIYILGVLPLPIDANGLLSGYNEISYIKYIAINFLGKLTVYALVGYGVLTIPHLLK